MTTLLFFVALVWNIFASFWNARVVGKTWYEAKAIGGFTYVAAWAGAIMSAIGFTKIGESEYQKDNLIAFDLKPRNVLRDTDGDIFVIDVDFKEKR
jgi:hypothetical protein